MGKRVLAFDFGASSGRAMLAQVADGKLKLSELYRFDNVPVTEDGHLRWNFPQLYAEVKEGIRKAVAAGGFDAIGIDSWGVDYGLIGADGRLLENPVHYRDAKNDGAAAEAHALVPREELYARTGIQFMSFNTVYQLHWTARHEPEKIAAAQKILLIADLFAYMLTGEMRMEKTNASTTGLLDAASQTPDAEILRRLGIPARLLAPNIDAGEVYGTVSPAVCAETGCAPVPVVAVATHDTASAVASVPTVGPTVYISCGTWSLMGTELKKADVTDPVFTNEIGYGGRIRYLKNIMGLWIIQETRRAYGLKSFGEMVALAEQAAPMKYFVDVDDPAFLPPGDMPARVRDYCRRTGQGEPETRGEVIRTIYESLAMRYRSVYGLLCTRADKRLPCVNMVGGGINAELLCRMTASACGCRVEAGPDEATALGNAAVQLIALGELSGLDEARELIRASVDLKLYSPENADGWNKEYRRFCAITSTL